METIKETFTEQSGFAYEYNHDANVIGLSKAIELAECYANPKWIPLEERLPEVNEPVLVYIPESEFKISIDCYMDYQEPFKAFRYLGVTHWMPLPEPPKP